MRRTRKISHILKVLQLNNRGTSLVELIVCLLVISIAFTPLLMSFSNSMKVNKRANDEFHAETVAENVMEAVKAIGHSGTKLETLFEKQYGTDPGAIWDKDNDTLSILKVTEGSTDYQVDVVFDDVYGGNSEGAEPTPVVKKPNEYQFADMSAFSDETSAMIFPGIGGLDFDSTAINSFWEDNVNYMALRWNEDYSGVWSSYLAAHDAWAAAGATGPEPRFLSFGDYNAGHTAADFCQPDPAAYNTLTIAQIKDLVTRTITVTIRESQSTTRKDANNKYIYEYTLDASIKYILNNSGGIGVCANPSAYPTWEKEYSGFCAGDKHDSLKSLFLMYSPFNIPVENKDLTTGAILSTDIKLTNSSGTANESVLIDAAGVTQPIDFYIALQTVADNPVFPASELMPVDLISTGAIITLYSQAPISVKSGTAMATKNQLLKDIAAKSRIYNVTVTVKDSEGNVLATSKSTVLE